MSVNTLMQAVFAALAADAQLSAMIGSDKIFDRPVTRAKPPYLLFGPAETRPLDGDGGLIVSHQFTIDAVAGNDGRRQAEEMAKGIIAALDDADLSLDGAVLVSLTFERSDTARERRTGETRTRLRFRAVIEPSA